MRACGALVIIFGLVHVTCSAGFPADARAH